MLMQEDQFTSPLHQDKFHSHNKILNKINKPNKVHHIFCRESNHCQAIKSDKSNSKPNKADLVFRLIEMIK